MKFLLGLGFDLGSDSGGGRGRRGLGLRSQLGFRFGGGFLGGVVGSFGASGIFHRLGALGGFGIGFGLSFESGFGLVFGFGFGFRLGLHFLLGVELRLGFEGGFFVGLNFGEAVRFGFGSCISGGFGFGCVGCGCGLLFVGGFGHRVLVSLGLGGGGGSGFRVVRSDLGRADGIGFDDAFFIGLNLGKLCDFGFLLRGVGGRGNGLLGGGASSLCLSECGLGGGDGSAGLLLGTGFGLFVSLRGGDGCDSGDRS